MEKGNDEGLIEFTKKQIRKSGPIRDFKNFKLMWKRALETPYLSDVVSGSVARETETEIEARITDCAWQRKFKELDATDLGYAVCCKLHYAMASCYHPKIKLKRTKTLMQGDSYCNHTYFWEE